jgi:hypothetical protein
MKTYQVTLNDETAAMVDKMLQDGPWESIDELFVNSIGTLQEDVSADEHFDLDILRAKLQVGLDDIAAGRTHDADDVFNELMEYIDNREPVAKVS